MKESWQLSLSVDEVDVRGCFFPGAMAVENPSAAIEPGCHSYSLLRSGRQIRPAVRCIVIISTQARCNGGGQATRKAGILNSVNCQIFRHAFATHLLEDGYDIRTVHELLGHKDVKTTMIYTHVLNRGGREVKSPLDGR